MIVKVSQRNGLNFELNKNDFTAKTVYSPGVHDDLIIPRSIMHENQEYIVIEIGQLTFKHNERIRYVEFPSDTEVKTIADKSFYNCSINNFTLPSKVNSIGENAFHLCYFLKSIEIPENSELHSIGSAAFSSSPIEKFSIPSKVNDLKNGWCKNLRKLVSISISPDNKNYSFLDNEKKILIGKSEKSNNQYDEIIFACRDIEKVCIRPNINRICSDAFSDCENLSRVEFNENSELEFIDKYAFKNCFALKLIEIPVNVKSIGHSAFSKCRALQKVCFSEFSKLEKIEEAGFSWSSVEYALIPRNVKYLGSSAFIVCKSLKTIEFLCDEVEIGKSCFSQCKSLFIASFPSAKKISLSTEVFESCSPEFTLFTIPKLEINFSKS